MLAFTGCFQRFRWTCIVQCRSHHEAKPQRYDSPTMGTSYSQEVAGGRCRRGGWGSSALIVGCPLAATYHDWMMKISHKNADDLGFIYCLPCDSPRFLQMGRNCGFFPGCNMNFVKRRRGDSDVVPWNSHHDEGTFIAMSFPYRMGVSYGSMGVMWVKQCHKPPIWEWFIPSRKMLMTGGWCKWHCCTDFSHL